MWMMGYNEGGHGDFNMPDSFNGRKLRPLIPRPLPSANNITASVTTPNPSALNRIHGSHDFFAQYHHLAAMADQQSKRSEFINTPQVVVSSRWNPTPEQLRALEELYRRGTRTPSAEQIQHITAQLRKYGKIEGKNVFYWFQNHKARERQKRRRQMESSAHSADHDQPLQIPMTTSTDYQKKESLGSSRTVFEFEQTKNWAPSTNCSTTTLAEESVSIPRAAKAGVTAAAAAAATDCRTDGWIQFGEEELQQRRNFVERNATWQMMQLSCPPHSYPAPTHLINTTPTACTTANYNTTSPVIARATVTTSMDQSRHIKPHDLSIFIAPYTSSDTTVLHHHPNHNSNIIDHQQDRCEESQTLQLFPLRSGHANANSINDKDHPELSVPFFEFLPLKN